MSCWKPNNCVKCRATSFSGPRYIEFSDQLQYVCAVCGFRINGPCADSMAWEVMEKGKRGPYR